VRPAIETRDYAREDIDALADRVRSEIAEALQAPVPAPERSRP
jgi:hypothetical protein